jgi:hypothetical protein
VEVPSLRAHAKAGPFSVERRDRPFDLTSPPSPARRLCGRPRRSPCRPRRARTVRCLRGVSATRFPRSLAHLPIAESTRVLGQPLRPPFVGGSGRGSEREGDACGIGSVVGSPGEWPPDVDRVAGALDLWRERTPDVGGAQPAERFAANCAVSKPHARVAPLRWGYGVIEVEGS